MQVKNLNSMISADLKVIGAPLLMLVMVGVSLFVTFTIGWDRIVGLWKDRSEAMNQEAIYQEKLNTLSQFSVSGNDTNSASVAIPPSDPALFTLNQLKKIAESNEIFVLSSKLNAAVPGSDLDIHTSSLTLEINATDISKIISFIQSVALIAPVSNVTKIDLEGGGPFEGEITVVAYWSSLPDKLPALTEPVVELSALDTETLKVIQGLVSPDFVALSPSSPRVRENPFAL